jgi:hypothetical protein
MTLAAVGRMALVTVLDRLPDASAAPDQGIVIPDQKIKFTVRLHRGDVARVVSGARASGISHGAYLSALIDGAPPPLVIDPQEAIAALGASTDRLAAIAAHLDELTRAIRRGTAPGAQDCGRRMEELTVEVRRHLGLASGLMADLNPARPRRRGAVRRSRKERTQS